MMFHKFHKDKDTEVIHRFMHNFRPRLRQSNLRPSEIMVLMMISHFVDQSKSSPFPSQISKALNLSRPAITPILNQLEKMGYIIRQFDPIDRRKTRIVIQDKAMEAFRANCNMYQKQIDLLKEQMQDDFVLLLELMEKANQILSDQSKENINEESI
jgi:DNA-binding MarR family transcriptional regulator